MSAWVPWRKVIAFCGSDDREADFILYLECGHAAKDWPRFSSIPYATKCIVCDPAMERG